MQEKALNCRLQIEHVNSDCAETDDGSLALAFLSLRFLSASQILRSKMTCAEKLDYSEEKVRRFNLTLSS